jgi:hypothetical protein
VKYVAKASRKAKTASAHSIAPAARKTGFVVSPATLRVLAVLELTAISVLAAIYFGMLPL